MRISLRPLVISSYQLQVLRTLFVFMVFHFSIHFSIGGIPSQIWPMIYGGIAIIWLTKYRQLVKRLLEDVDASGMLKAAFFLHLLAVLWALIIILFRNGDFSYFKELLLALWYSVVIYSFLLVYIYKHVCPANLTEAFMMFYLRAQAIYILFSVLFILFPSVKTVWISYISVADYAGQLLSYTVTRVGLKGFASFGETIRCSIGVLFCLYLIGHKRTGWFFVCLGLMLLGNMFYGRSGLLFSIGAIFLYCMQRFSFQNMKLLFLVGGGLVFLTQLFLGVAAENERAAYFMNWMLKPLVSFYDNWQQGRVSFGYSGDYLLHNMYFMPQSDWTLLLGDGQFSVSGGRYYMDVDAGLMRHMLFYGLIGELLGYMSFGCLLWNLKRLFMRNKDYIGRGFCTFFLFLALFFEIKGECYFSFFGIIFALCLCTKCENENGNTSLNC